MGLAAYWRLVRAGYVLAREGAFSVLDPAALPPPMRAGIGLMRIIERPSVRRSGRAERLTRALKRLGPTYVKFGQTLATRPDIVGPQVAEDLSTLQDRMEPFDPALVPGLLEEALGEHAARLTELSAPVAAASIAQVHRATLTGPDGLARAVAIKILRPGIAERFGADLESFRAGARLLERLVPPLRRLRPLDVVATLERSAALELDLRLEAAAISEMTGNIERDAGFRVPVVHWEQTARDILTTDWIEAIPIRDFPALAKAGLDRKALAEKLLQGFLRHAIRDGFFHADMHPGNLFADPASGDVIAVDFGIMGRLGPAERRFLADVVYGFITRNYRRIAERHFEIGYVPRTQSVDDFALALRAIGEPLQGRSAREISMARVLGQLFTVTDLFSMQARPELILLQKNMVLVEGVARALDPELDIWTVSEPVVGEWLRREEGPIGRIEDAAGAGRTLIDTLARLPGLVRQAETVLALSEAQARAPRRGVPRWMVLAVVWLAIALGLAALFRLVAG